MPATKTAEQIAQDFELSIRWRSHLKVTTSYPKGIRLEKPTITLAPKFQKSEAPPGWSQPIKQNSVPYGGLKDTFVNGQYSLPLALKADIVEPIWQKELKELQAEKTTYPPTHKAKHKKVDEKIAVVEARLEALESQKQKLTTLLKARGKYPLTEEQANRIYDRLVGVDQPEDWNVFYEPDPTCEYWQMIGVTVPESTEGVVIDDTKMKEYVARLVKRSNATTSG